MQKVRFAVRFKRGTSLDLIQRGDQLNYCLLESIFMLLTTREYIACDLQEMKNAKRENLVRSPNLENCCLETPREAARRFGIPPLQRL